MEKKLYDEMTENLAALEKNQDLKSKNIYLFGHCEATLTLIDLLLLKGYNPVSILDNSNLKQGKKYKDINVVYPAEIKKLSKDEQKDTVVLIVSRFYASMFRQLRELGFNGRIEKIIDYNSYSEYSLSKETINKMWKREQEGENLVSKFKKNYGSAFKVYCPFNALGDIYFMISYWPAFAKKRGIKDPVFLVTGEALCDVISLFSDYRTAVYEKSDLDKMIQASLYTNDKNSFIAHQDRPYVINLAKALYVKKIPLDKIYCCGVYGLLPDTLPQKPDINTKLSKKYDCIKKGKSVIFSPYAKSVPKIPDEIWQSAIKYYKDKGYDLYTNVAKGEAPLNETLPLSPSIKEFPKVVERAGTFVGIRSGLCDIIRETKAKKIALYPDYYYGDTKWKAIDMYFIEEFDQNIEVSEDIKWETL